jgi:hypothetical protein
MTKRATIVLSDKVIKKLREKQAKMIAESSKSIRFSRVINEVLSQYLK